MKSSSACARPIPLRSDDVLPPPLVLLHKTVTLAPWWKITVGMVFEKVTPLYSEKRERGVHRRRRHANAWNTFRHCPPSSLYLNSRHSIGTPPRSITNVRGASSGGGEHRRCCWISMETLKAALCAWQKRGSIQTFDKSASSYISSLSLLKFFIDIFFFSPAFDIKYRLTTFILFSWWDFLI